jgi:hypothetical protein
MSAARWPSWRRATKTFSASSAAKDDYTGLGGPASSESGALLRSLR